jgi:cystathionine beta-lyase family protein involved in aluminum resistance
LVPLCSRLELVRAVDRVHERWASLDRHGQGFGEPILSIRLTSVRRQGDERPECLTYELVPEESEGKVDEVRVRDELLEESMLHLVWKAVGNEKISVQVDNVRKMVDDSVKIRQTIQLFP